MLPSLETARELCTKDELALVRASRSPALEKLTPSQLKSHVSKARQLTEKWQDLSRSQARSQSRQSGSPDLDSRSVAKRELFQGALQAFEAQLATVGTASAGAVAKPSRPNKTQLRQGTRKTLHQTRKKMNAASSSTSAVAAAASKPATTTKAASPAAVKPKVKKSVVKAEAKKKSLVKKATARAAKKAAAPAVPVKAATKVITKPVKLVSTKAKQTSVAAKAKANRVAISNRTSNIAGHVSGKGKRAQARRDGKG
jgi:hypothetical protein